MKFFFYLPSMGLIKPKTISRYCPFKEAIGEKGLKVAARACVKSDTGSICILISPFDI